MIECSTITALVGIIVACLTWLVAYNEGYNARREEEKPRG